MKESFYAAQLILIIALWGCGFFRGKGAEKINQKTCVYRARKTACSCRFNTFYMRFNLCAFPGYAYRRFFSVVAFSLLRLFRRFCAFLCRFVKRSVDKAVTRWYINDAKRILKEHKDLTVIGITGSYGKTSTKFILNRILSEKYNVVATPHSFNTPMGVVRTVREYLKPQTQIFICEMGAKNIGDIKEICDIVHPRYGIITSVGEQHLDTFKTVDNVFKTKFELATEVLNNGGEMFVNGDSKELISRIDKTLYSVYGTDSFDFKATDICYGKNGSDFTLNLGDSEVRLSTRLLGLHNILNIAVRRL